MHSPFNYDDKLSLTVDASHSFRVLSSEAETMYLDSCDHAMSEIPCLCPVMVLSNLPSYAPQIFTVLSAATIQKIHLYSRLFPNMGYKLVTKGIIQENCLGICLNA